MPDQPIPIVAIIGRPNVGKSTLFNRLLKKRRALVDATPGVTRDRLYGDVQWRGVRFRVVDTGGLQFDSRNRLGERVASQVAKAVEEASMALFVGDAREGLMPLDKEVASWIRRWGKPVLVVVNKVDSDRELPAMYEFSSLGFGEPIPISGQHGLRIGELLDALVQHLHVGSDPRGSDPRGSDPIRVAVVGRPNVGKSSLVNRIANEERVLVDEEPGTTRDPVEVAVTYRDRLYYLIDTAGVRSQRTLKSRVDAVARIKALEVIQGVDVCLGVLEGPMGIIQEDLKLFSQVVTAGKPFCLAVNKWDLMKPSANPSRAADPKRVAAEIARRAPFLRHAPVVLTSAKTGLGILKLLDRAAEVASQASRQITRKEADQLLEMVQKDPRAPVGVRNAHLFRLIQVGVMPPTFHLMCRVKQGFRASDLSYLEGFLRRELKLVSSPIRVHLLTGRE